MGVGELEGVVRLKVPDMCRTALVYIHKAMRVAETLLARAGIEETTRGEEATHSVVEALLEVKRNSRPMRVEW